MKNKFDIKKVKRILVLDMNTEHDNWTATSPFEKIN